MGWVPHRRNVQRSVWTLDDVSGVFIRRDCGPCGKSYTLLYRIMFRLFLQIETPLDVVEKQEDMISMPPPARISYQFCKTLSVILAPLQRFITRLQDLLRNL